MKNYAQKTKNYAQDVKMKVKPNKQILMFQFSKLKEDK